MNMPQNTNKMKTNTYRTDVAFRHRKHGAMRIPYEVSCKIEQELAESQAEVEFYKKIVRSYVNACKPIREMSDKLGLELGQCIIQDGVPRLVESHEKAEAEVERLKSDKIHLVTQCANLLEERSESKAGVERMKDLVKEAARKGDELLEPYRQRAEKAETLLKQIYAFVEALNQTKK